jgi:pimeloyl-ACP methyl ester carboxylesterase
MPDADAIRARTVVALAGTFCAPLVFERLAELLDGRFALHAPSWMTDAPAWGVEDVSGWVADRISAGGPDPVLVVGHSTGGAIALRLALTRPDLVGGLMLVNTGPHMHGHGDVTSLISTMERDGTAGVARAVVDRSFHTPPPPEDRRLLLDYGLAVPVRAAMDVLRSQHATDFTPALPALRMPVSVVHGRFDGVRTVEAARAMAAAVPDGHLRVVDAGHTPVYEAPGAVADALVELDRRVRAARGGSGPRS